MSDRQALACQTAADLYQVEESCDTALQSVSEMITRLISGRREAGLSVTVGHDLVALLHEVQGGLTEARGAAVRAHQKAEAIRRLWGVTASTPTDKDPPNAISPAQSFPRAVA